jgi:hypothetical protein
MIIGGPPGLVLGGGLQLGIFDDDDSSPSSDRGRPDLPRHRRLDEGPVMTLYHQTDHASAQQIHDSQQFRRGSSGLASGGIYFATSASDTHVKAHRRGVILRARVRLGTIKTISSSGDSGITFTSLQSQGYDSVKVPRPGGTEYVVYNYDQVYQIEFHR